MVEVSIKWRWLVNRKPPWLWHWDIINCNFFHESQMSRVVLAPISASLNILINLFVYALRCQYFCDTQNIICVVLCHKVYDLELMSCFLLHVDIVNAILEMLDFCQTGYFFKLWNEM